MTRGLQGLVGLGVLLSAGAAWAIPQDKVQQQCINKLNKDTIKVEAAQAKVGSGCVKDFVKTGSSAETCLNADVKDKVGSKVTKESTDEGINCTTTPDFAYTSGATEAAAGEQAGKAIMHDAFGSPLDNGLYACAIHPIDCLCQRQGIDRVVKLFNTTNQIFVHCKKEALAIMHDPFLGGATSPADIEDCVTNASTTNDLSVEADAKGKISTATGQLATTLSQFCSSTPDDPFVDGTCSGHNGDTATQASCLAKRVKCRFCLMENAADNLSLNCTTWSGTTCP